MQADQYAPSQNLPPRVASTDDEYQVFSGVTGAAASSHDLWTGYTADHATIKRPAGKCWIELEATANIAYVRFSRTASTGTTVANGAVLQVGVPRRFYIQPDIDLFMDVIAAGVGTIKWRRVGAIAERSRT